jgi:polar amino acid transport system permease protein
MPTIVQLPLIAYIELFRCTPLLVQLVWIYYALPVLIGVNIPAYTAGALALSLYAGSFYAEIFRGGVSAIDRGQWDAARAVGMRQGHVLRRIVLPQAFRLTIPPIINQTVLQLKNTSLISTLAVGDLLYQGSIITAATYRPLEVYTMVAVLYFAVLFPTTQLARCVETWLSRGR